MSTDFLHIIYPEAVSIEFAFSLTTHSRRFWGTCYEFRKRNLKTKGEQKCCHFERREKSCGFCASNKVPLPWINAAAQPGARFRLIGSGDLPVIDAETVSMTLESKRLSDCDASNAHLPDTPYLIQEAALRAAPAQAWEGYGR